jgi:hypothetical protein
MRDPSTNASGAKHERTMSQGRRLINRLFQRRFDCFLICSVFFNCFPFAMDDDLNFRNQINREADMCNMFAQVSDGLHVNLMFLDFEAGLFRYRGCHILCGYGAIQFACITRFGAKGNNDTFNLVSQTL